MMSEKDCSLNLDPAMMTASLKISKTSQVPVIFRNVEETYPVGVDVHCAYTVSEQLEVSARDWVGLYKVGWRSQSDYIYYDWATVPQDYTKGKDFENKIVFPAQKLPKDDGEFYQFCYVTSGGQVRGASTPFQFRQLSVEDLIEVEDENGELLVIRTKTALLEEKLKKANDAKLNMKQQIQLLENERNMLLVSERQLQQKLFLQKEEGDAIWKRLEEASDLTAEHKSHIEHLQVCIGAAQEKMEVLNQEKATMEKRLDENDAYIVSLQEKIKTLVNEKDALNGRVKSLEEEGEQMRGFVMENDRLKARLMEEEICGARMKKVVERMEDEIRELQTRMDKQLNVSSADKETIEFLFERLHNAEDKLSAAEHCKMMLNEEVLTVKQAYEKMSSNLEESKAATDSVRKTLCLTEQNLNTEIKLLNEEKHATQDKLDAVTMNAESLSKELEKMKECLEEKCRTQRTEAEGSMYALEMAQATLKERFIKISKTSEAKQRALDQALCHIRELENTIDEHKQKIDHLMESLQMAEETYKDKYLECEHLERKLFKMKLASVKRLNEKENSLLSPQETAVTTAALKLGPTGSVVCSELSYDLEDSETLTEKCYSKMEKYKQLYIKEKLLNEKLVKKLLEKDEDVKLLKDFWLKPRGPPADDSFEIYEKPSYPKKFQEPFDFLESSGIRSGTYSMPLLSSAVPVDKSLEELNVIPSAPGMDDLESDQVLFECQNSTANGQMTTATNTDTDRFEDAPGEPQRTCPVCAYVFSFEDPEEKFHEHIDAHFGTSICPMCSAKYPDEIANEVFVAHVNSHFM